MTSAIVFVLTKHLETDAGLCIDYCAARGYDLAALVRDDWAAALSALHIGVASILVVANVDHLDDSCTPRMEVAAELPVAEGPKGRRIRMLRRNGGA